MYSFKGGAGRTVTTANVALILASELGRRLVLLDIDVESAGSSVLFGLDEAVRDGSCWSLQDILRGYHIDPNKEDSDKDGRTSIEVHRKDFETNLWPKVHATAWAGKNGYLKVLPAQIILRSDSEKVGYPEGQRNFEHLLMKIDTLQDSPDIILYDSASGQQQTAMLGLLNCHILVIFVRWSRQFIIGTTQFLRKYVCQELFCRRVKKVLIVPTAVPRRRPPGRLSYELDTRERRFKEDISLVNAKASHDFKAPAGWVELLDPIHECDALKWDDRIFLLEGAEYQQDAGVASLIEDYRALAHRIANAVS